MTSARITDCPPSGLTPEEARNVRARVWGYVFECYARKKAAHPSGPDDRKGVQDEPVKNIIPK